MQISKLKNKSLQFIKRNFFNLKDKFSFLEGIIISNLKKNRQFNIVQVGAWDGKTNDPLFNVVNLFQEYINLLAIEPHKPAFSQLKYNYRNLKNIYFENKLIGDGKIQKFYTEKGKNIDNGLSSLEKSSLLKRVKEEEISFEELQSYKLLDVINNYKDFEHVDLLQIDVEGYDDKIILESNILETNLRLINYEHKNLESKRIEILRESLRKHKYQLIKWSKSDELAIKIL